MGVLTLRFHGSITALAAMAALSTSSDSYDKSCLRSFVGATTQTLLLSSSYAPTSTSFVEFDPSMGPAVCGHPPLHTASHVVPFSPLTSHSSALRFYRAQFRGAESTSSLPTVHPLKLPGTVYKFSPLRVLDAMLTHTSASESLTRQIHWKYPVMAQNWHAHIARHLHTTAHFSVPRLPHMIHFEKLCSLVYSARGNPPMASSSLLHTWHGPAKIPESNEDEKKMVKHKPSVAVVLLGWLGAEHRHLKKYADWYTSRGVHAVTFIVPMKDLFTLKAGDRAEKHVDVLTQNLVEWLREDASKEDEKIVIFHTFSNTGWLTYGAVLERLISQGDDVLERIKGCVVDSAPSARPDPHVWASGFSAALLKKGSVATQMLQSCGSGDWNGALSYPKPSLKETALLAMLENFFSVFLQIPYVNRRLNDVVSVLANQQPTCPQLYIYSSADTVIPVKSVESFIEEQRKAGHMVKACNFQCSPHVDHFRTYPDKYGEQLTNFLKLCVPQWAAQ